MTTRDLALADRRNLAILCFFAGFGRAELPQRLDDSAEMSSMAKASGETRLASSGRVMAWLFRLPELMAQSTHITWHAGTLTREDRHRALKTRGCTLWFTGLSASGKSTIASALERVLVLGGVHAYRLDGDNLRMGLNNNLGFSATDRAENIRRFGEVAKLFADSGSIAITSVISPYAKDRDACRELHATAQIPFFEIFVDTPLDVCEARDPKGLYKKARAGELKGFTGIDDPYEPPVKPELVLKPASSTVEQCVDECLALLKGAGMIK